MTSSLILHCGAQAISREELGRLPTPAVQGTRHAIRNFADDVDLIHDYMQAEGVHVEDEAYGVLYDKDTHLPKRFFGAVQVRIDALDGRDGYGLVVGIRGSYDQSLSRALAVGSRVFVCDNLAFSGEVDVRTKQTTNIDRRVPEMLQRAVAQIPVLAHRQDARFSAYRNAEVSDEGGDHMLVNMVREGVLMPSQLGHALEQWDEPDHAEHAEQGRSLWRLHNAVTQAIKPANPRRAALPMVWERTKTLTEMLDIEAGYAPMAQAA